MNRIRIVLGAINDQTGGPALILTQGLGNALPTVEMTKPSGERIPLVVSRAPIASFSGSAFAEELARRGVALSSVAVPGGLIGSVGLMASLGGLSVPARFRPFPVKRRDSVSFSVSSCYYGYFKLGAFGRSLWTAADSAQFNGHQIDFKLFVGDNLYLDVAPDQDAFDASEEIQEVAKRYVDYWLNDDELSIALASSPTLLTFDDHDLWNDYPHSVVWLSRSWPSYAVASARAAWDGIDTFQRPLNPPALSAPGRSYKFVAGGIPFFVADTRTNRSVAGDPDSKLLPPTDLAALESWLAEDIGPRVLIVGQPLWQSATSIGDHNLAAYSNHFARICAALHRCPAEVLVVTGDPHFSRVLKLESVDNQAVYEIVSSPAVHIPSVGAVIGHNLLGTALNTPSRDAVSIDQDVAFSGPADARLGVAKYLYGSSCNTTFALVTLTPRTDGSVEVRVTFVNHQYSPQIYPEAEVAPPYPAPVADNATVTFTLRPR